MPYKEYGLRKLSKQCDVTTIMAADHNRDKGFPSRKALCHCNSILFIKVTMGTFRCFKCLYGTVPYRYRTVYFT